MSSDNLIHQLAQAGLVLVPMILSLSVHEFAHAFVAKRLGDDTAQMMGRLTLNPIAHIDLVGTIILPIMLLMWGGGFFFGWAKPVPVNPARFNRRVKMRTGMMLTAAAGPLSNLVMATICMGIAAAGYHLGVSEDWGMTRDLLSRMLLINVGLAVFNMIPVPPLDGGRVAVAIIQKLTGNRISVAAERLAYLVGFVFLMALFAWLTFFDIARLG